jgi:molybdopterin-guanine dinucleotide biosynthesis protein A
LAGIILSGGENRRMGREKAFLTLKGRMFLWMIIEALTPLFEDLILVTRQPDRYAGFPVRTVRDLFQERGPLTGIISGLSASRDPKNFCVGCDMPLIKTSLVQYMMNMAGGSHALIPVIKDPTAPGAVRIEPLHGIYDKTSLPIMERNLRGGRRSLHAMVRYLNVRYLPAEEVARFDPDLSSFRNINTREEYQALSGETSPTVSAGESPA